MKKQAKNQVGEAYAFFDCNASRDEIEKMFPHIRAEVKTPSRLELALTEGINPESFRDVELMEIARDAKEAGIRYFLKARCQDLSNKQTADETAGVLTQAYQSPLYQDREEFRGGIFYEENGRYVKRN